MAKREHGYIALIPVFIPVQKNDLPAQIAAATALHEASTSGSLEQIMALDSVRLHVKPGGDIKSRWTSVQIAEMGEAETEQTTEESAQEVAEDEAFSAQPVPSDDLDVPDETTPHESAPEDAAQTHGRRRSRAA